VKDVLADRATAFYEAIVDDWQWNNRYWEQRALAVLKKDPEAALRYASQAVGIERHPMALTTLARIQLGVAQNRGYQHFEDRAMVIDGLKNACDAIDLSKHRNWREIHPHDVAVHGTISFLKYASGQQIELKNWDGWDLMSEVIGDLARVRPRGDAETLRKKWVTVARQFGK
jgi:hypothetical protein